jgi:hypothetical protein
MRISVKSLLEIILVFKLLWSAYVYPRADDDDYGIIKRWQIA